MIQLIVFWSKWSKICKTNRKLKRFFKILMNVKHLNYQKNAIVSLNSKLQKQQLPTQSFQVGKTQHTFREKLGFIFLKVNMPLYNKKENTVKHTISTDAWTIQKRAKQQSQDSYNSSDKKLMLSKTKMLSKRHSQLCNKTSIRN